MLRAFCIFYATSLPLHEEEIMSLPKPIDFDSVHIQGQGAVLTQDLTGLTKVSPR